MPQVGSRDIHPDSQPPGAFLGALACRLLTRAVVSTGLRNRLSILIYHRVRPEADSLFPDELDAARFNQQIGLLKQSFTILPLSEAIEGLRHNTLPHGAACITFDDGYADNVEIALPILARHGIKAAFFLASGFLNGGRMWNDMVIEVIRTAPEQLDLGSIGFGKFVLSTLDDRRSAIRTLLNELKYLPLAARQEKVDALSALAPAGRSGDLMMTSDQVRALHRAGMEIGAHTVNHPILARTDADAARHEIRDCKLQLEAITGAPVRWFAYPNGKPGHDYYAEHVAMVREAGFEAAVSTAWGAAGAATDMFQLPRFTPVGKGQLRFTLNMIQNLARTAQAV